MTYKSLILYYLAIYSNKFNIIENTKQLIRIDISNKSMKIYVLGCEKYKFYSKYYSLFSLCFIEKLSIILTISFNLNSSI